MGRVVRYGVWAAAFVAVVVVLFVAMAVAGYLCHRHFEHVPSPLDMHMTTVYVPEYQTYLLALLKVMDQEATRHKCAYWISGGTMLGHARFGGMLPFDDDADTCMEEATLHRFVAAVNGDPDSPLQLFQREPTGSIWRARFRDPQMHMAMRDVDIDIFPLRKEGAQGEKLGSFGYLRTAFPDDWCYTANVYPLQRVRLNDVDTWAPAKAHPYLDRQYPGWQDTIYLTHAHLDFWTGVYLWLFQRKRPVPITPKLRADLQRLVDGTLAYV